MVTKHTNDFWDIWLERFEPFFFFFPYFWFHGYVLGSWASQVVEKLRYHLIHFGMEAWQRQEVPFPLDMASIQGMAGHMVGGWEEGTKCWGRFLEPALHEKVFSSLVGTKKRGKFMF